MSVDRVLHSVRRRDGDAAKARGASRGPRDTCGGFVVLRRLTSPIPSCVPRCRRQRSRPPPRRGPLRWQPTTAEPAYSQETRTETQHARADARRPYPSAATARPPAYRWASRRARPRQRARRRLGAGPAPGPRRDLPRAAKAAVASAARAASTRGCGLRVHSVIGCPSLPRTAPPPHPNEITVLAIG